MEATHLGPGWDLKRPSRGHHVQGKAWTKPASFLWLLSSYTSSHTNYLLFPKYVSWFSAPMPSGKLKSYLNWTRLKVEKFFIKLSQPSTMESTSSFFKNFHSILCPDVPCCTGISYLALQLFIEIPHFSV